MSNTRYYSIKNLNKQGMYNKKNLFRSIILTLFSLCLSQQMMAQQFKILLITETAGWHHESIDNGIIAINELAQTHNFEVVRQQKARKINEDRLKEFDAVVFLSTTADIFDKDEQLAFEKYIQSGKDMSGFMRPRIRNMIGPGIPNWLVECSTFIRYNKQPNLI